MKIGSLLFCGVLILSANAGCEVGRKMADSRMSQEKANQWYKKQPWLVGCNFVLSTSVNQLEMWQAETFDAETIDRELGWAESIGFNTVRVFLHNVVWHHQPVSFKERINRFLEISDKHHIRPVFVLFDDCWNDNPKPGKQPEPIPGVHNSRWVQCPGSKFVTDPNTWSQLEDYVKDILRSFGKDERILMWDLYNEPGNSNLGSKSLPLLEATFKWARQTKPTQPLTVGVWSAELKELNEFQIKASDIISFHHYGDANGLISRIEGLEPEGRPIICTEYMSRGLGSRFETHLPIFKERKIGCYNWGLVSGRTQTIYPWGSPEGAPEPQVWFHDILRRDGTPFDPKEVEFIKELTSGRSLSTE